MKILSRFKTLTFNVSRKISHYLTKKHIFNFGTMIALYHKKMVKL